MNAGGVLPKKIGFLTFGHWRDEHGSQTRTAADALLQTIDVAQAADDLGVDGAFVRVHHFQNQLASPFPLLAAIGARTRRIEIGTGVIDMRYENPLYTAEEAAAADLISGGRLQLGVSRGIPIEIDGWRAFGYQLSEGESDADLARDKVRIFLDALEGTGVVDAAASPNQTAARLPITPHSPGLRDRIWWGSATRATGEWVAAQGMNLMSSTLLTEDTGVPFDQLQAEQIDRYREVWRATQGWQRIPRVSVSRTVLPITTDLDRRYFGGGSADDQVAVLHGRTTRFGRSYIGEPDVIAAELAQDEAVRAADTLLLTIPSLIGVEHTQRILESIIRDVAPAIGWRPNGASILAASHG